MFRLQLDIENMSASIDPMYKQDPAWVYLRQTPEEMMALQSRIKFDAKKSVWVADPEEGFITGEIKSSKGEQIVVVTSKESEKTLNKDEVQQMNPPKYELTEDMADLTFLNEASVLHNLRQRYYTMMIYTYSGLFCVVINPYRRLPIYSEAVCRMYIGRRRNEMPPHLFSVCDEAYRNMVNDHENQSMLITGESGAGKTENTKKVISYFAIVGSANKKKLAVDNVVASPVTNGPTGGGKKDTSLEEQVVRTNPVLEAFGNAKTVRNNNSSRFGKFIRIHFNTKGKLAGADIEHYLLEKSRVIKQASGERSYHIFYQLMSDAVPDLRKKLHLTKTIRDYHFVSCAEVTIEGVNDKEEMGITDESFDIMNFTPQEKFDIFALTAGIMHMGEIKWKQRPREEQAECEDMVEGELACKLFKVDINKFIGAFLKPRVKVGSEWVNKGQTLEQVTFSVGALAKALYARMFHWLIIRCNATLDAKNFSRNFFIGVLDIAGFEIFDLNSFEQLWINFVNERLQQFFNHHMFVLEQEEYTREGIKWEFIDFGLDLQACIELIEKPLGMISMLDEECIVPKATDLTLAQKLIDQHLGKHPNFQKARPPKGKQAEAHFAIVHYAGTVRYNVKFWLEKNKDPLNDSVVTVLKGNDGMGLLSSIWESYLTQEDTAESEKRVKAKGTAGDKEAKTTMKKKGKSSSFMTVSMIYRESLNNLMNMLNQTHPHFIRCIIPNEQKKAGVIEANLVLNQLTCNGVLEGIRICRKGYPNRVTYPDFKQRYAILAANLAVDKDAKVAGKRMCAELEKRQQLKVEEYQCGSTKIFFRAGVLAHLEELRDEALSAIIGQFQRACRHYLAMTRYRELLNQQVGMKVLQRNVRKWCTLRHWPWFALLNRVKPLIKAGRKDEEFDELSKKCKDMELEFQKEEKLRREMEAKNAKLVADKLDLGLQLEREKEALAESEERSAKLLALKSEMEKQLTDLNDQLADQEDKCGTLSKAKKKLELDNDTLKKSVKELDAVIKKQEMEKQSKEHQIRSLQDEAGRQDECIAKLNKEKKHQEEVNRKLQDDLHAEEEKLANMARAKTKLEQSLDQLEDTLEREKRARQELDKQRRKAEGELKVAHENFEELSRQKQDVEQAVKKREAELVAVTSRLEDEQSLVARLQRQIKELLARVQELEEELAAERQARAKAEKMRNELQIELEELSDRLDEAGGATYAQIELNKKREGEIAKLRRDVEEQAVLNDQQLNQMRKKHQDALAELSDQIDAVHKSRTKVEKEKAELQREVDELQVQIDAEVKQRQNIDRLAKQLETQLLDSQLKGDEQARQLHELLNWKSRTTNELGDMTRQLEDAESQVSAVSRVKSQLAQQVEEQRRQLDATEKERQQMASQVSNYQLECQQLREQLEEERDGKTELQRLLSKANAEMQQWRAKFEGEGLNRAEELEDAKRRLQVRMHEVQEQFEQANLRIASMEKARQRQQQELEDAQLDAERAHSLANALDKKQKGFDKIVEEWKRKADSLGAELEASQQETRNANTEVFRLRGALDEAVEQIDAVRRENKVLEQELKDLTDQLGEGGKNVYDAQKAQRRLELEKDELQQALEDAEAALEAEESKVLRAQVEISQIRAEIEKRIAEKEEEFENTRKNHQRAMDSMQASLEAEARGRTELAKTKKKLEIDINDLEISLDQANKANVDAQRNLKRYQETIRELQQQIDEEQHSRDELRDQLMLVEKRSQMVQQEKEELATAFEQTDRARRQAETEAVDVKETANSLASANISLTAVRRKLETDLQHSQTELNEALAELKSADERTKKAFLDAARLAEELRVEQEHAQSQDRQKKALDGQLKDLQLRLEDAEAQAMKGGKKTVAKLEQKLREVEVELQEEGRRHQETHKNLRNKDRRVRELQFQVEEDKKSTERMYDLVEKLQAKLKTYKRQAEEAEQLASVNLTKYRQIQHLLEDAEERADIAENNLTKMRTKSRSSIISIGGGTTRLFPAPRSGLSHSASSAALMHSASAMNNHVNHYPSQQVARSRSGEVIAEETE